jgi:hypothetical protein
LWADELWKSTTSAALVALSAGIQEKFAFIMVRHRDLQGEVRDGDDRRIPLFGKKRFPIFPLTPFQPICDDISRN